MLCLSPARRGAALRPLRDGASGWLVQAASAECGERHRRGAEGARVLARNRFRCTDFLFAPPRASPARPGQRAHTTSTRMFSRRSSKGSRLTLTLATSYTAAAFCFLLYQRSQREAPPPAEADSAAAEK